MIKPAVLVVGAESPAVLNIIQGITCKTGAQLSHERHSIDGRSCYPWLIDNKYYSAEVEVCDITDKQLGDTDLLQRCEAIVVVFSAEQVNGLDWADTVHAHVTSQCSCVDVCLLVCDKCDFNSGVSTDKAQQWCVVHGYELVELADRAPCDESDAHEETTGIYRIIEALHAHTWSNLTLKGANLSSTIGATSHGRQNEPVDNSTSSGTTARPQLPTHSGTSAVIDLGDTDRLDDNLECDGEFERLFARLAGMRATADSLPRSQRHLYAEQIATQFMSAFGEDQQSQDVSESD